MTAKKLGSSLLTNPDRSRLRVTLPRIYPVSSIFQLYCDRISEKAQATIDNEAGDPMTQMLK